MTDSISPTFHSAYLQVCVTGNLNNYAYVWQEKETVKLKGPHLEHDSLSS